MTPLYILAESLDEFNKCVTRFKEESLDQDYTQYLFYRVYSKEGVESLKNTGFTLIDGRETSQWIEGCNIPVDII